MAARLTGPLPAPRPAFWGSLTFDDVLELAVARPCRRGVPDPLKARVLLHPRLASEAS